MIVPNFKITICELNHYFSVHCVLFGLFLLHLSYNRGHMRGGHKSMTHPQETNVIQLKHYKYH